MRVMVCCEFSGVVREAFRRRGHDAWSVDILPAGDGSSYHIQDDALNHLDDGWDMIIAFPPCTYLANSGVRWLHEKPGRWEEMKRAAQFFNTILNADVKYIAVENPIQHRYARQYIRKYDQIIQPWQFGIRESKAICLWLKNLPPLKPLCPHKPQNLKQRVWREPPGPDRWKQRVSWVPYRAIAEAMAEQWGSIKEGVEA